MTEMSRIMGDQPNEDPMCQYDGAMLAPLYEHGEDADGGLLVTMRCPECGDEQVETLHFD